MTILKLGCLNLHIGNGTQYVWRGVNPMPAAPCPTFAFNDQNTYKHQHALNAFVLDLVKSRDSCNNNNSNNNNNNNNIHSMTSMTSFTLRSMTLTLHLITTCLIRSSRHLISIFMTSLTPQYRGCGGFGGGGELTPAPRSAVPLFGRHFDLPDTNDLISTSPAPARLRRGEGN